MNQLLLREHAFGLGTVAATPARTPASSEAPSPVVFSMVGDMAGLEALEADWNELFDATAGPEHVFQGFNWCWHWCRHYLGSETGGPRLAILTGRIGGRLVLILPLVAQRVAGLTELAWLGEPVSQYGDALATAEGRPLAVLTAALRHAVKATGADVANLRRVREDAIAAPILESLGSTLTATEEAPFLDLSHDRSFADWEKRRKPSGAKNRKRLARRLADKGDLVFGSYGDSPAAGDLARKAALLKRTQLAAKGAISRAVTDPRFAAFFADAAEGAGGRPAGIVVKTAEVDGKVAAAKVLVDCKGTRFLHIAVYDDAFEKCGAGVVLLETTVRRTIEHDCERLDLLPPRHEYKMDYADGVVLVHDHALAFSAKGWLYTQGFLKLRRSLKVAIERLPAGVRRALARRAG